MLHRKLTGAAAIHPAAFVQDTDPAVSDPTAFAGSEGPGKVWIDITDPAAPLYKVRNATNDDWDDVTPQTPLTDHATTHENGGGDEISVAGLSGLLADGQIPLAHKTSHQSGGSDAIKLDDLAAPDDNTDLDASTAKHGLLPKLGGGTTNFLRADGTWNAPAGGGGGGSAAPEATLLEAPGSPSAYDDEFTSASIDAKWTQVATPNAAFTVTPDYLGSFLRVSGGPHATNALRLRQGLVSSAGTPLQATLRISLQGYEGFEAHIRLDFQNGSTWDSGDRVGVGAKIAGSSLEAIRWANGGGSTSNMGRIFGPWWLHLQRQADNLWQAWVSLDGMSWDRITFQSMSFDVNYMFLSLEGATGTVPVRLAVDFVRVNDARFTVPTL